MTQAIQRLQALAAVPVKVTLATLLATFPKYRDTIMSIPVGEAVVVRAGSQRHIITRVKAEEYTMEKA